MDILTVFLFLGVFSYIGYLLVKVCLYYRRCKEAEHSGDFVRFDGDVIEILEERKRAVHGKMIAVGYPHYKALYNGEELSYTSMVSRVDYIVGEKYELCYEPRTGVLWADGDLLLMKRKIVSNVRLVLILMRY